ncbi:MAG: DUF3150 domain-containing protein [Succinatimonas hippei]|nr:DUF3150 domain-containing protein [Succinatimonas hippei]
METTQANANPAVVKTAEKTITAAMKAAVERLGLFEIWGVQGTILSPDAILSDACSNEQVTDSAKAEIAKGLYKAKTEAPIFSKERIDALKLIRRQAYEFLDSVGVKSEGTSEWTILANRHDEVALKMNAFKQQFEGVLGAIVADYPQLVAALQAQAAQIGAVQTRDEILKKIPSLDGLKRRCQLRVSTQRIYTPDEAKTASPETFAIDLANALDTLEVTSAGFWGKVTRPFASMLKDIEAQKLRGKDYSQTLGKKRSAMGRCVAQAKASIGDLRIAFGATPDAGLVEEISKLLNQINERFCSGSKKIPTQIEPLVVEVFFRVAHVMESLENIKGFIKVGNQLFESWFDLRDPNATAAGLYNAQHAQAESFTLESEVAKEPEAQAPTPEQAQIKSEPKPEPVTAPSTDPELITEEEIAGLGQSMGEVVIDTALPETEPEKEQPVTEKKVKEEIPEPELDAGFPDEEEEVAAMPHGYDPMATVTDLSGI